MRRVFASLVLIGISIAAIGVMFQLFANAGKGAKEIPKNVGDFPRLDARRDLLPRLNTHLGMSTEGYTNIEDHE